MAKKKTRKQKILADQRHVLYHLETTSAQVSLPSEKKVSPPKAVEFELPQARTITSLPNSYAYVLSDIRRTVFITLSIIAAQVILFIVLHRV